MHVIVDSDGLIGISHTEDIHYPRLQNILHKLRGHAEFIYPATTIAEATAILQIRLNKPKTAKQIIELVKSGILHIESVDENILIMATLYLDKEKNKHVTLFDGVVAAVAEKYQTKVILSFDSFYKKQGFTLATELK